MKLPILTSMKLSEGHAAVVDAYEEFLIVKDVLTKIDDMLFWARKRRAEYSPIYALPEYHEIYKNIGYVEVSDDKQREAEAVVKASAEKYCRLYDAAAGAVSGPILDRLGLPRPIDVQIQAADRPALRPWWARLGHKWSRILPYEKLPSGPYDLPRDDSRLFALNVPDPTAAITFRRNIVREERYSSISAS